MSEAVSGGAIDGDAVHGQGLGSVDREGLDRRVLDGKSIAIFRLAIGGFELYREIYSYMEDVVKL